jgi:hypothetical protein
MGRNVRAASPRRAVLLGRQGGQTAKGRRPRAARRRGGTSGPALTHLFPLSPSQSPLSPRSTLAADRPTPSTAPASPSATAGPRTRAASELCGKEGGVTYWARRERKIRPEWTASLLRRKAVSSVDGWAGRPFADLICVIVALVIHEGNDEGAKARRRPHPRIPPSRPPPPPPPSPFPPHALPPPSTPPPGTSSTTPATSSTASPSATGSSTPT